MAILSKTLVRDDMKELTITQTFSNEPFSAAERGVMKVKDEKGLLWKFKYKVSRGTRIISGHHWQDFLANNGVQVGHKIAIHQNDPWCAQADYKIEVTNRGPQTK